MKSHIITTAAFACCWLLRGLGIASDTTLNEPGVFSIDAPDGWKWTTLKRLQTKEGGLWMYLASREGLEASMVRTVRETPFWGDGKRITEVKAQWNGLIEAFRKDDWSKWPDAPNDPPRLAPPMPDRPSFHMTWKDKDGRRREVKCVSYFGRNVFHLHILGKSKEEVGALAKVMDSLKEANSDWEVPSSVAERYLDAIAKSDAEAVSRCWLDDLGRLEELPKDDKAKPLRREEIAALKAAKKDRETIVPIVLPRLSEALRAANVDAKSLKHYATGATIESRDGWSHTKSFVIDAIDKAGEKVRFRVDGGILWNGKWYFTGSPALTIEFPFGRKSPSQRSSDSSS